MAVLSPLLEKLVLTEKASLRTTVVGKSGQAVIPVGADRTVIIVEFDYQHFIDFVDPDNLNQILSRSVHQLSFKSKKSRNHFIIRDNLQTLEMPGPTFVTTVNGYYRKETFLVHNDRIIVQIVGAPFTTGTISTPGAAPANVGTEQPPLGYGFGAFAIPQTVNEEDFPNTYEYSPLTVANIPFISTSRFKTSQLLFPVSGVTALNPTFNVDEKGQRTYPIVNITYVEINRSLSGTLFSSS